ncbi:sensor domain-containing diguanylate cyclase [Paraburkholderia pallida]|uniref:diguanylate cyclase n=1 Tax=Paraburkholderia pallida TaxID=2547399 RepID=A0A4P7CZA5_9BURK|nr:sensor domain-containing diguanylate cyclase [Paraburkholderia pallida]QBR01681.1 sensor domain-containing diguanylate cyclase [Paraburkholderia pallida]
MNKWPGSVQDFVNEIAASVAVIAYNAAGELIVTACNDSFLDMTGIRRQWTHSSPVAFDAVIPSYARSEFREKLRQCFTTGTAQELEQVYDLKGGTRWWRLSLKPLRHAEEGYVAPQILVTGLDITQRMELMRALEVSTSRFRSVVDAAYDAIITMDQRHNITLFNHAAEKLFWYEASEMIGEHIERLIPEEYRPNHAQYVDQFARSPIRSREMDERNRVFGLHRDGSLLPAEAAISKINVDGVIEFTAVIRDITDRMRLMDLFQKQAITDELTGLPNRRQFIDATRAMMESDEILSVFILDVDYFKKINDTYGHDGGDEVLRALGKAGTATSRQMDIFARWGGEEFVAALPGTDAEQAREIAEKLRSIFENQDFAHTWQIGKIPAFTVSIGVATRAPGESDLDAILRRADEALYRAKNAGRNRVEVNGLTADASQHRPVEGASTRQQPREPD